MSQALGVRYYLLSHLIPSVCDLGTSGICRLVRFCGAFCVL